MPAANPTSGTTLPQEIGNVMPLLPCILKLMDIKQMKAKKHVVGYYIVQISSNWKHSRQQQKTELLALKRRVCLSVLQLHHKRHNYIIVYVCSALHANHFVQASHIFHLTINSSKFSSLFIRISRLEGEELKVLGESVFIVRCSSLLHQI